MSSLRRLQGQSNPVLTSLRGKARQRFALRSFFGVCLTVTAWTISGYVTQPPQPEPDRLRPIGGKRMAAAQPPRPAPVMPEAAPEAPTLADKAPEPDHSAMTGLIFAAPTQLAALSSPLAYASILQDKFVPMVEEAPAPPPVETASLVETPPEPEPEAAPPLPPPNPFREKASERTVVARVAPEQPARVFARTRAMAKAAPVEEKGFFERIFGAPATPAEGPSLAYAPSNDGLNGWPASTPLRRPMAGDRTAVYDIEGKVVIMPNGQRLEAHSGLGSHMDDPRFVHVRMRGATPPNVYNLRLRESLFHGVRAIRLTPVDNRKMFGRDGILAHTYMLGPRGDSNGCVSFKDYNAFLNAFLRGEVTRLVVVANGSSMMAQASLRSGN